MCQLAKATLIIDPPLKWGPSVDNIKPENFPADIGVSPGAEAARFAAVYWPRILRPDPLMNGFVDTFAPSGMIAGIMARTDNASGVWTAPAGNDAGLIGANGVAVRMTEQECGYLNSNGVNSIRSFAATGPVLWGARTIRGSDQLEDDYKYLNVRRLTDYIEQTLMRQTRWAVFQNNDETLWDQLGMSIRGFMTDLWSQGALAGGSMADAFWVKVDSSTTTARDVDLGIVNVHIGFAPVRPAEFVILYLQQLAGGSQS
jgi:phage tail sheath protein FI